MALDATDYTMRGHFEACLLWLFGWILLCGSDGNSVEKHLIRYT